MVSLVFIIPYSTQNIFSHGTLDQSVPDFSFSAGSGISSNLIKGQVFTPTAENLTAVDVSFDDTIEIGDTFIIRIHQGTDSFDVLGIEHERIGTVTSTGFRDIHLDLDSPVPLLPGEPHILEIANTGTTLTWLGSGTLEGDTYPGGFGVFCNVGRDICGELLTDFDHNFRTYFQLNTEDRILGLIDGVNALNLNDGNKNALTKKLTNAINNITNEDPTDDAEACDKLQAFINALNAKVNSGELFPEDVGPLIDITEELIDELCM